MPTPGNSINEATTGICGFTGTAFTGTAATAHAVLVGGSTSSTLVNVGPTSTAGQILQSAGASADPSFSTATYPSTAGTSGNILTSDGTNWNSTASSSILLSVKGHITSAQIKALRASPVQLIAAPGTTSIIFITYAALAFNYAGSNVFVNGSASAGIYYATATSINVILSGTSMTGTANTLCGDRYSLNNLAASAYVNTAVNLFNPGAAEFTGNAANDNTVSYEISYFIMNTTT